MTYIPLHNVNIKIRDKEGVDPIFHEFMKLPSRIWLDKSTRSEALGESNRAESVRFRRGEFSVKNGFTLVEVVLTLGIVAIFIGVLGMFPQMLDQSRASNMETRASRLARQIVSDLTPSPIDLLPPQAANPSAPGQSQFSVPKGHVVLKNSSTDCVVHTVDLNSPDSIDLWYDLEGRPVTGGTALVAFQAKVTVTPDATRWGLSQVLIQVQAADSAPAAPQFSYSTKIAIPASVRQSTTVTASNP